MQWFFPSDLPQEDVLEKPSLTEQGEREEVLSLEAGEKAIPTAKGWEPWPGLPGEAVVYGLCLK